MALSDCLLDHEDLEVFVQGVTALLRRGSTDTLWSILSSLDMEAMPTPYVEALTRLVPGFSGIPSP
jgi:hypothetical protein